MPSDGTEPIEADELLYRRVRPVHYHDQSGLSPETFHPDKDRDTAGISLTRAKYSSIEQAAVGHGKEYYVAVLRAGALKGLQIIPDPIEGNPGHCLLPELNSDNRRSDETSERKLFLRDNCIRIDGPFPGIDDINGIQLAEETKEWTAD